MTGGEVTMQSDFAAAVLAGCREQGIHTAIETCGACTWKTLKQLVDLCDLILYDIKLIDSAAHRRWTGSGNATILDNARRLPPQRVQVRIPLIPEITDTNDNLRSIFNFMDSAGLARAAVLPFNPSAAAKYEWLDRPFPLAGTPRSPDRLNEIVCMGAAAGLQIEVV